MGAGTGMQAGVGGTSAFGPFNTMVQPTDVGQTTANNAVGQVSPAMGVNPDGTTTPNAPYMPIMGGMTLPINNPAFSSPPNIALPAMGVNPDGTTTPAPPQIWNERTGQYQSQTDTTPGAMPGPIGGLSGLIAGENPTAPVGIVSPGRGQNPDGSWNYGTSTQNVGMGPQNDSGYQAYVNSNPGNANPLPYAQWMTSGSPSTMPVPLPSPNMPPPIPQNSGSVTTPQLPPRSPVAAATTPTAQPMAPQLPPRSPVAAATPGVTGTSYMNLKRPSAAPSVLNQFGTRLNQVRQAPGATPQAPQVNPRANLLSNLARFRKR